MKYLILLLSVVNIIVVLEVMKLMSSGLLGLGLFLSIASAVLILLGIVREKV
jgi:hypothetical protein